MRRPENLKAILSKQPLLKGLRKKHLDLLAACAVAQERSEGEYLLKEGQSADYFFLIKQGRVSIELKGSYKKMTTIQTLDGGEILGWSWLIAPYRSHFSARAVRPASLLAFDAKRLRAEMKKDHDFGYEMLRRFSRLIAQRLEEALPQIISLYS